MKNRDRDAAALGKRVREAAEGNTLVGLFASELAGRPHLFTKPMWDELFKLHSDEELGYSFAAWRAVVPNDETISLRERVRTRVRAIFGHRHNWPALAADLRDTRS